MNPSLGNRYSQHSFSRVPTANTPRSKFDRSFAAKDTMEFDYLTPFFIDEVLPGDTINLNVKTFMRLATQAVPMMENMYIDFYFFFVPNRLVWDNFQKFMGEQDNPGDSTDYVTPKIAFGTAAVSVGSIFDHFGLPTTTGASSATFMNPIALPLRGYNLVWNQWFRDQNLQNSVTVNKGDGPDAPSAYTLLKGGKKHDYFTSALPFSQKGPPSGVPISGTAPVWGNGTAISLHPGDPATVAQQGIYFNNNLGGTAGNVLTYANPTITAPAKQLYAGESQYSGSTPPSTSWLQAEFADSDTYLLINNFRTAMQVQAFLEQDARGGTRYTEILKAHFNVISPDARLQRTEFLSGATINISQHPVAQTSETNTSPQANLAAYSTAAELGNKIGFSKSFLEHGYVIGLAKARADITYQQGLNKMWTRNTKYDYFWPKFQELSEQVIENREIRFNNVDTIDKGAFGWQERYAEYRFRPSEIKGQFRSTFAESLDIYHLAEEFSGLGPNLNATFIQSETPIERALVVAEGYPALLCDYWFDYKHIRPMVTYPVPVALGRF